MQQRNNVEERAVTWVQLLLVWSKRGKALEGFWLITGLCSVDKGRKKTKLRLISSQYTVLRVLPTLQTVSFWLSATQNMGTLPPALSLGFRCKLGTAELPNVSVMSASYCWKMCIWLRETCTYKATRALPATTCNMYHMHRVHSCTEPLCQHSLSAVSK